MSDFPSLCGCRACGGAEARQRALLAMRVVRYAPFIPAARKTTGRDLANRHQPRDLYSRLVMAAARRV